MTNPFDPQNDHPGAGEQPQSMPPQGQQPQQPQQPAQPAYPQQPAQPAYPQQPAQPAYPQQPAQPAYPQQPAQPGYNQQPNPGAQQPGFGQQPNYGQAPQFGAQQPGYGAPAARTFGTFDAMESLSFGARMLGRDVVQWLIAGAIPAVVMIVAFIFGMVGITAMSASATSGYSGGYYTYEEPSAAGDIFGGVGLGVFMLGMVVASALMIIYSLGVYRVSALVFNGQSFTWKDVYNLKDTGKLFGVIFLTALAVNVGMMLCILPGMVLTFLLVFAPAFVVLEPGRNLGDAFSRSLTLAKENVGPTLILVLLSAVIMWIASMIIIGPVLLAPVFAFAYGHAIRRAQNIPVPAV